MKKFEISLPVLIIITALFCVSCSDDNGTAATDNSVNISSVIAESGILSAQSIKTISADTSLKDADCALISYLKTDKTMNRHIIIPGLLAGGFAVAKYKDNISAIVFNDTALQTTSPLVFPGYFYTEHLPSLTYSQPINWSVNYKGNSYTYSSFSADSVYRVTAGTTDSVALSSSLTVNWTKSYSVRTSLSSAKVYISFVWYPSFSDADYGTALGGFFSGDTGVYMTSKGWLNNLNIPDYGILQVNVCRYSVDKFRSENNLSTAVINAVETGICLYIK